MIIIEIQRKTVIDYQNNINLKKLIIKIYIYIELVLPLIQKQIQKRNIIII